MQMHRVSTAPNHSIPYSDIELADQKREERPEGSNIEPIFRDSSLSDLEDNNDVQSAENYPLDKNNSLENPWRMGVRVFQALPFTGTSSLQQDVVAEDSTPSTRVIKMAKSIRSKHRRKMRNVKREHFAKKGLESLKKMAAADAASLQEVVTMKSAEEVKAEVQAKADAMEVDKAQKVYNKKTKQDEDGHYPEWMNQRAVKKQKKKLAKSKKKPGKKIKW